MVATGPVASGMLRANIVAQELTPFRLDLILDVTAKSSGFSGHFPDFPILPGVVQLDWAIYYARHMLQLSAPVMTIERLKFTCPIQPETRVSLTITADAEQCYANFRFYHQHLVFSQGRLVYG